MVWQASGHVPTLLQQLLAERMGRSIENMFRLMELALDWDLDALVEEAWKKG